MALTKIADGGMPSGSVVQVVSTGTINESIHDSNQGTWQDTNYTLAIAPSATSSKILVHFHFPLAFKGTGTKLRGALRLNRTIASTTTLIWNTSSYVEMFHARDSGGTPDEFTSVANVTFLDSPSTTSATTYTVQQLVKADSGSSYVLSHRSAYGGAMILTEVKD
jgi:hypothetical protein